jgi:tmRNA-binding protein
MNRQELIEHYRKKTYIGDSVYVHFDGYHFILETINGYHDDPRNRIALEPDVIRKLLMHKDQVYSDFKELQKTEEKSNDNNDL